MNDASIVTESNDLAQQSVIGSIKTSNLTIIFGSAEMENQENQDNQDNQDKQETEEQKASSLKKRYGA